MFSVLLSVGFGRGGGGGGVRGVVSRSLLARCRVQDLGLRV